MRYGHIKNNMPTSCSVRIVSPGWSDVWLYRRDDGFLAEGGAAVLEVAGVMDTMLKRSKRCGQRYQVSAVTIARAFLELCYPEGDRESSYPVYDLIDGPAYHCSHVYVIDFDEDGVSIGFTHTSNDRHRSRGMRWYTPSELARRVNADRRKRNVAIRKCGDPEKSTYTMLNEEGKRLNNPYVGDLLVNLGPTKL